MICFKPFRRASIITSFILNFISPSFKDLFSIVLIFLTSAIISVFTSSGIQTAKSGYARVSRLLGQDAKLQLINIKEFAAARGYELINEYIDEDISGAVEKRRGLDQLMADASKGKFQVVIVSAHNKPRRLQQFQKCPDHR